MEKRFYNFLFFLTFFHKKHFTCNYSGTHVKKKVSMLAKLKI